MGAESIPPLEGHDFVPSAEEEAIIDKIGRHDDQISEMNTAGQAEEIGFAPPMPNDEGWNKLSPADQQKSFEYWNAKGLDLKKPPQRVDQIKDKLDALYAKDSGELNLEERAQISRENLLRGDPERVARQRAEMYGGKPLPPLEKVAPGNPEGSVTPEELKAASDWAFRTGLKTNDPKERLRAYREWKSGN